MTKITLKKLGNYQISRAIHKINQSFLVLLFLLLASNASVVLSAYTSSDVYECDVSCIQEAQPFAVQSMRVYQDGDLQESTDWRKVYTSDPNNYGFNASVYLNDKEKTITVTYAGTADAEDIFTDGAQYIGIYPKQFEAGRDLAESVLRIKNDGSSSVHDYSLVFTGHSLGGGIAAFVANIYKQKAITFNPAPFSNGTMQAMDKIQAFHLENNPWLFGTNSSITNIVSHDQNGEYDYVSASRGTLLGSIKSVNINADDVSYLIPTNIYERHSINNIVTAMSRELANVRSIVGVYDVVVDGSCHGDVGKASKARWVINSDGTFIHYDDTSAPDDVHTGHWTLNGTTVTLSLDRSTTYTGKIDQLANIVSGTMLTNDGQSGCWSVKIDSTTNNISLRGHKTTLDIHAQIVSSDCNGYYFDSFRIDIFDLFVLEDGSIRQNLVYFGGLYLGDEYEWSGHLVGDKSLSLTSSKEKDSPFRGTESNVLSLKLLKHSRTFYSFIYILQYFEITGSLTVTRTGNDYRPPYHVVNCTSTYSISGEAMLYDQY